MNITTQDVINEVRKLAAERPDFIYTQQLPKDPDAEETDCSYVSAAIGSSEGEGCIVGQALSRLDVPRSTLLKMDGLRAQRALEDHKFVNDMEYSKLHWLDLVQIQQDTGNEWGYCVSKTDETYSA